MAEALPTADEAFADVPTQPSLQGVSPYPAAVKERLAAGPAALPTADEAFGEAPPPSWAARADQAMQSSIFRIQNAFGIGARAGFGDQPIATPSTALSPETEEAMRKAGLFNDYAKGQHTFSRGIFEGVLKSAIAGLALAQRAGQAALEAPLQAIGQTGEEVGLTEAGTLTGEEGLRGAATDPGLMIALSPFGGVGGLEAAANARRAANLHVDLSTARANAVIGEGEAGFRGTVEPTVEQQKARDEAVANFGGQEEFANPFLGGAPQDAQVHDLHGMARQIAPEVFQEYDVLSAQRDLYRRSLQDLGEARAESPQVAEANQEIETILGKVGGIEDRLTKKQAGRVAEIRQQIEDYTSTDTAEMTQERQALQAADVRMRDLAPQVSAAYREAETKIPVEQTVTRETEPNQAPEEQAQSGARVQPLPGAASAQRPVLPEVSRGISEGVAGEAADTTPAAESPGTIPIATDVSQKLVAAGRPQEEADAAAALVQAHYEARAARFNGAKGTSREMYAKDSAGIVGAEKGGPAGSARGKTVLKDGRATITLFGKADASTFVHETGHSWLNELVQDAKDERAPADLAADAKTVRSWLGVKDGEDIPTRAHEKFARGFERYLMEGTAPSAKLAGVFAKFRNWLTQIYQTVSKLRSPITDDIRAVFDRLLAEKPERTVIAPEAPIARSIHDIHEEEAASVAPARATKVADHIDTEIEQITEQKKPELADEIRGKGPSGIPASDAGVPGGGNEAGPNAAGPEGAARSRTLPARGNETAQEGAGVQESAKARKARIARSAYEKVPREPQRLADFVRRSGGITDVGGDVRNILGGANARPGLINGNGLDNDAMALRAWENGYFPELRERPTIKEFVARLEDDLRGNPQYSEHHSEDVADYKAAIDRNSEIDRLGSELGIDPDKMSRDEFAAAVSEHMSVEDMAKEAKDRGASVERDFADAERDAKEWMDSHGGWEPDEIYHPGPARTLEDLERERDKENAAYSPGQREVGAEPSRPAATDQGQVQESGGSSRSGTPAAGRTTAESEPNNWPNQRLEPPESPFIDKAGNIRLDNLNSTEDVNATLRDFADRNNGFIQARRGVVSAQEIQDFADANGLSVSDVNIDKLRQISVEDGIPLAARILGGRQMLVQSASAVHDAMQGEDELAYAEVSARHLRIQETMSGITAEWGRAGQAFRKIGDEASKAQELSQFLKANTGKTLFQIKREMQAGKRLDSPAKVSGFLRDVSKPSLGEMILEAFKNWLISGPWTHATYTIGNKIHTLYKAIPETAVKATVGAIQEAIAGKPVDRVYFGEIPANAYAFFFGQRNGLMAAWDSFKAGQTAALPGEGSLADLARQRAKSEKLTGPTLEARVEELKKSPTKAMLDAISGTGATTQFTQQRAIPGVLGTLIRIPGERLVAPIHAYDRAVGYEVARAGLIYRRAQSEGLTGDAFTNRVAELTNHTPDDITAGARDEATQGALMGRPGEFTQRWSRFIRSTIELPVLGRTQPLSFIEPFVNIASNINRLALIERTPLGLISRQVRDDLSGVNGTLAQSTAIAKMGLGTAVAGVAGGLAMQGWLTRSAPADRNEAAMALMEDGLPHSIKIGGMAYQLNRLGVIGMQLAVAADLYSVAHLAGKGEFATAGGALVHSIAQNFLDEGYASGIADLLRAVEDSDRYGESYIRNFIATSAVPFSVGMTQVARTIDPYQREARTLADAMLVKIPGASMGLKARRDVWGEMIPNNEFRGVYARQVQNDPVNHALIGLGIFPGQPDRKIRGVDLTDAQYDQYQQYAGRMSKGALTQAMRGNFASLPIGRQEEIVRKTLAEQREQAGIIMMTKYPRIMQAANQAKQARATSGSPKSIARRIAQ